MLDSLEVLDLEGCVMVHTHTHTHIYIYIYIYNIHNIHTCAHTSALAHARARKKKRKKLFPTLTIQQCHRWSRWRSMPRSVTKNQEHRTRRQSNIREKRYFKHVLTGRSKKASAIRSWCLFENLFLGTVRITPGLRLFSVSSYHHPKTSPYHLFLPTRTHLSRALSLSVTYTHSFTHYLMAQSGAMGRGWRRSPHSRDGHCDASARGAGCRPSGRPCA